jgi:5-formyltetrahydrofolate cyclo-ligase
MSDPHVSKAELRERAKLRRRDAHEAHRDGAARAVVSPGLELVGRRPLRAVSGYLAIGDEIDPAPLLAALAAAGHTIALPVMAGKGKPLVFRGWRPGDPMVERMWGIREPAATAPEVEPDVLLVPLLAFDAAGWRLGYGAGFYDRTLRALRQTKPIVAIGLAYDEQRVDAVPHCDDDERLDWVLTPSGARACTEAG